MINFQITPKSLILSIMQVADERTIPIKALIVCGDLFGFTSNTIRVTVTRLIREKTIESDERGYYRLGTRKNPVSRFIKTWRMGEKRLVAWDERWLCVLLPHKMDRSLQVRCKKVLEILGFREGLTDLWVRPFNLIFSMEDIVIIMKSMGMHPNTELFIGQNFSRTLMNRWKSYLWDVEGINQSYSEIIKKLEKSHDRIPKMPVENAMVESYIIGGEAIHILLTDPLLPTEIQPSGNREKLTRIMLSYDDLCMDIWVKKLEGLKLDKTPSYQDVIYPKI